MTWRQSQQAFFDALVQEKVAMFIILTFIILVAAFNITSTLIMVVMEKRHDIGILRTLGVSSGSVLQLFVLQGLFIGLSGTDPGRRRPASSSPQYLNPIAEFIAGLLGLDFFNSQIYFFDRIPWSKSTVARRRRGSPSRPLSSPSFPPSIRPGAPRASTPWTPCAMNDRAEIRETNVPPVIECRAVSRSPINDGTREAS
jgi:hypothetical protein